MHSADAPVYSIVIPIFNEESGLVELYRRLAEVLRQLDGAAEVILVDDGSRDRSFLMMEDICSRDPRFQAVRLSRNFGHQMALTAGCDYARGQATVTMDADLQDPPEVIIEMAKRWREGYEIIYAVRNNRDVDTTFKKYSALAFYHILRSFADIKSPVNSADFRMVDRKVLRAFRRLREKNRYIRGLFSWLGFKQTEVYYQREARYSGETKYPLWKMLKLAFDAIVSFSNLPLRMCMAFGFIMAAASLLIGIVTIIAKLAHVGSFVLGWASLIVVISFIGGVHMLMLGVLGEYLARVYDEVRDRPLYLVSEIVGRRPVPRPDFSGLEELGPQNRAPHSLEENGIIT